MDLELKRYFDNWTESVVIEDDLKSSWQLFKKKTSQFEPVRMIGK